MDFCKIDFKNLTFFNKYEFFFFSISGSSATIYAYLGEFHNERHRSRAIMCASVIYGLVCILLPGIAWLVINQNWEFTMPIIDRVFKPWRLFLIVCATPSLLCSLAFIFLPESPKFVLAQGNQVDTIAILEKINRWNNGKNVQPLQISELYEEAASVENRRKVEENKNSSFGLLKSMWAQSAPLFMAPHLRTTILACAIQFGIFLTSNGMYMWFPDILNRVATDMNENPGERVSMCSIIYRRSRGNFSEMGAMLSVEPAMVSFCCSIAEEIGPAIVKSNIFKLFCRIALPNWKYPHFNTALFWKLFMQRVLLLSVRLLMLLVN